MVDLIDCWSDSYSFDPMSKNLISITWIFDAVCVAKWVAAEKNFWLIWSDLKRGRCYFFIFSLLFVFFPMWKPQLSLRTPTIFSSLTPLSKLEVRWWFKNNFVCYLKQESRLREPGKFSVLKKWAIFINTCLYDIEAFHPLNLFCPVSPCSTLFH